VQPFQDAVNSAQKACQATVFMSIRKAISTFDIHFGCASGPSRRERQGLCSEVLGLYGSIPDREVDTLGVRE
jgi:hypothetical protein